MADAKQVLVEVVVVERAFLDGKLVEPGAKRTLDLTPTADTPKHKLTADGKQRKLPRWAALPNDPAVLRAKKPVVGDTRPADAQRASAAKATGLGALT